MNNQQIAQLLASAQVVDLGHTLRQDIPGWSTHPHYMLLPWEEQRLGAVANHFQISMGEHNGTHIDASSHFVPRDKGGRSIDQFPLETFRGPCLTLRFDGCGPDYLVSRQDICRWEDVHGPVGEGDIVLFYFGWSHLFAPLPAGRAYVEKWPGIGADAAAYLAEKRIKLLGVDTFAADIWSSTGYETHLTLLPRDILILEGLNNLDLLPPRAYFLALPLALEGGSGSPLRPIAICQPDGAANT